MSCIERHTALSELNGYGEIAALRRGGLEKLDLTWSRVSLKQDGCNDLLAPIVFYLPRSASSLVSLTLRSAPCIAMYEPFKPLAAQRVWSYCQGRVPENAG